MPYEVWFGYAGTLGTSDEYGMGYNCNDSSELDKALDLLIIDNKTRGIQGAGAVRCASEIFDRASTYHLLVDAIVGTRR